MLKVQYRPISLPRIKRKYKYIVIHDTSCMYPHLDFTKVDDGKPRISALRAYSLIFDKKYDLNYHYLCQYIKNDWESFVARPLYRLCTYPDMSDIYQNAIHVCQFGDFNIINGQQRMYHQMCYRVLAPMMFWFGIKIGNIVLHSQVSNNKDLKCPGTMFDFTKLIDILHVYILK